MTVSEWYEQKKINLILNCENGANWRVMSLGLMLGLINAINQG